jgi:hypothetical protein
VTGVGAPRRTVTIVTNRFERPGATAIADTSHNHKNPDRYAAAICIRARPDFLLPGYSVGESCSLSALPRRNGLQRLSGCHGFTRTLLLFLLGCLLCLLRLLRFLCHVTLRNPKKVWSMQVGHSTCMHAEYTTISKLIRRAEKKVNARRATALKTTRSRSRCRADRSQSSQDLSRRVLHWMRRYPE